MIVIGVDPDSKAHGVAIFKNGDLSRLYTLELMQLYEELFQMTLDNDPRITVSIEDVCANNAMFHGAKTKAAQASIGRRVGMVQQAQKEVERLCEYMGIPVIKNKISSKWKDKAGKRQFEQVTGWTGRSNEDTRSAAYFGWLHAKKSN